MTRALIAAGLSVAIPVAAVCAPLVHAHLDAHATDHHGARVVHAHFSAHDVSFVPFDQPRLGTHDEERTIALQVFVAVAVPSFDVPVASTTSVPLVAPLEASAHRPVDVVHGHDPPSEGTLSSRAPPYLPVLS